MLKNYELRDIFGGNIKKLRLSKKLTQAQLAEKVLVEPKHISCIENGLSFPSVDLLSRIADFFGLQVYELFLFEKKPSIQELKNDIFNTLERATENEIEKIYLYTKFVTTQNNK